MRTPWSGVSSADLTNESLMDVTPLQLLSSSDNLLVFAPWLRGAKPASAASGGENNAERLANNTTAPSSLVSASCSGNGPIKGKPTLVLFRCVTNWLSHHEQSSQCSQITDNGDGGKSTRPRTGLISDCFHTCLGFRVQTSGWEGREEGRGSGGEGGTSWLGALLT